jgi:RNA 2',3'-cyclic 3'-phosphodiesterase
VSDDKVRLFVALELAPDVRSALASWASAVSVAELRVLEAASLHVTLCFLGWRLVQELDEIAGACSVVAGSGEASLALRGGLWLPPRRPRVLAAGLEDVGGVLAAVQAELSETLAHGGWYQPEPRAFLPHVTVARVRREARLGALALPPVPSLAFAGTQVVLYQSRLGPSGARHDARARVDLS